MTDTDMSQGIPIPKEITHIGIFARAFTSTTSDIKYGLSTSSSTRGYICISQVFRCEFRRLSLRPFEADKHSLQDSSKFMLQS